MSRSRTLFTTAVAALALAACADASEEPVVDDAGASEAAVSEASTAPEAQLALGQQLYDDVCSECHSMQPPPDKAPPLTHIARRLKKELETEAAFTAHVVAHIPDPSEERSLLPEHAIERFGLMPAQALNDEQLAGVAAWLWVMADSAKSGKEMRGEGGGMGGEGGGMGGEGGGMRGEGGGMHGEGGGGMRRGGGGMGGGGGMHSGGGGMGPPPPDTVGGR